MAVLKRSQPCMSGAASKRSRMPALNRQQNRSTASARPMITIR